MLEHTKLYREVMAAAERSSVDAGDWLDDRVAICYRCPHTDGFGCAEFGCQNNPTTHAKWLAIILDPNQGCPILDDAWQPEVG